MEHGGKYIYLLMIREFIRSGEEVFKIGRTENLERRMKEYPKGSCMLLACRVTDEKQAEKAVIQAFTATFRQRHEFGREFFEGKHDAVAMAFLGIALQHKYVPSEKNTDTDTDTDTDKEKEKDVQEKSGDSDRSEGLALDLDGSVFEFHLEKKEELAGKTLCMHKLVEGFRAWMGQKGAPHLHLTMAKILASLKRQFGVKGTTSADGLKVWFEPGEEGTHKRPRSEQQDGDRAPASTNKLHEFLSMDDDERGCKIEMVEGNVTPLMDLKAAYEACMGQGFVNDVATLQSFGFKISDKQVNICKGCKQLARARGGRCCNEYDGTDRARKAVVYDMNITRISHGSKSEERFRQAIEQTTGLLFPSVRLTNITGKEDGA